MSAAALSNGRRIGQPIPHEPEAAFASRLRAAQAGARWAWDEIYRTYAPRVLGYLRANDATNAEDLLAETFVGVVREIARFSGGAAGFQAWIFRIAYHRVIDRRRRAAVRPEFACDDLPERAADGDVLEDVVNNLARERLARMLGCLPPDQRLVVYMRYTLDLPQAEIAEALDRSVGAVKKLQERALTQLRERAHSLVG